MNKTTIAFLVFTAISSTAYAHGHEGSNHNEGNEIHGVNHVEGVESHASTSGNAYTWNTWAKETSSSFETNQYGQYVKVAVPSVPNSGSADYSGNTIAVVNDNGARSLSVGFVDMTVNFTGNGTTTETGAITGLTGAGGAKIGDLTFNGTGLNREFRGNVTSTTALAGQGYVEGKFSPVVTPAGGATPVPDIVKGKWNFIASPTLRASGNFVVGKQ